MADHTESTFPTAPRSEPPATDEVDSGWLSDEASAPGSSSEAETPAASAESVHVGAVAPAPEAAPLPERPVREGDALDERAPATSVRPTLAAAPPRRGRPSWMVSGLLFVASTGLWLAFRSGNPETVASQPEVATLPARPAAPPSEPSVAAPEAPSPRGADAPTPRATATPEAASPPEPQAPTAAEAVSVTVRLVPPEARLFYKGKPAGSSGVVLTLEPGERRAFEVASPGYRTRRLVVDGKTSEVRVVLRPDTGAAP